MPVDVPSRILVTGGRGSLAGLVSEALQNAGHAVRRFSRSPGDRFEPLSAITDGAILDASDVLMHLAWSTVPYTAEHNPGAEETTDLPLLSRLLARLESLPRTTRPHLVFFSSGGSVYGNAQGRPSTESDVCAPVGRHGKAKLAAERLIEDAARRSGLTASILRISNPYGFAVPSARPQGIIPVAINAARNGTPMTLWGDGTARKDFLHHSDFTDAIARVVAHRPAGVLNIARGESHTVREVLELVERATGRPIATRSVPAFPWDVHDSQLDVTRLRNELGWRPKIDLAEGIQSMVRTL